ncbi:MULTISPECIES: exonuclease SbcCD subunit D [unclassified Arthrobacter]|uniref:exonuclease SbcCD subunit D n=1 Tax=unclassified Arthrobacter TaxID=235627 RepID=UPI001E295D34|nr:MULTISPECIES: exonuclease SbcCD subunit D [unclassified Arthrobacter]MCC9146588.1 exonuclease SbcCD subunit D [Arthrobacter sp. zg-Y919]MDK1277818.1 exonuclease SbcCD subunit D [Arthrobacter sp. zg.Y919]WIB02227.1 exonuclease SbcCD subunit D [Arthrobacter sp. zg-Y919]
MRLLHTSDWHLGRSFHGVGMLDAQADFIDRLVDTVREQRIDAVLIAGDVYDRALPAVDTVRLLDSALARITGAGAAVVLSSGNHDSAARLGFGSALFERAGVHLRTRYEDIARPVILPLEGRPVAVYGIPFLEPRLAAGELGVELPNHFSVTEAAVQRIRKDILAREQAGAPVSSVVLAHTFASGGISSDSERDLAVGGLGAVPLDLFEEFSYTALGHLHGRQQLSPTVRYSGSPLPYSFSEARQAKGGWLLEFDGGGLVSVEPVTWPVQRRLAVLRGKLEELLADPGLADAEDAYCQVTLTDAQRPAKAMELLRRRFPDTLVLAFDPEGGTRGPAQTYSQRLAKATDDLDVCCGFLEHVRSRSAADAEKDLFIEILDKVREAAQ